MFEKNLLEKYDLPRLRENVQNNIFRVAVVSNYAAGKTSFINSLLGVDILNMEFWRTEVTRVGYGSEVIVEIHYNDRKTEHFQGEYNGQKLTPQNIELIHRLILDKTTVQRKGKECRVKELVIKYPFKLCHNGVEIIDTPGFGLYNENCDEITNNILSRADAIIFLLRADAIGSREMTRRIKHYVGYVANSKVEKSSNYIFMVMNKSDTIDRQEIIPQLKNEIHKIFNDTIKDLQVYDVSAYYALKARMVQNGYADITYVQKDIVVTVADKDDFITGRAWNMDNLHLLLEASKIEIFENALAAYLNEKEEAEIDFVKNAVIHTLKENLELLEARRSNLVDTMEFALKEFHLKSEKFKLNLLKQETFDEIAFNFSCNKAELEHELSSVEKSINNSRVLRFRLSRMR